MKLLYLPNEPTAVPSQVGPRRAFAALHASGRISRLETFSFIAEARDKGTAAAQAALLSIAEAMKPDIVFWQHVPNTWVDADFVSALRARSQCRVLAYHDEDPYDRWTKRIDTPMKAVLGSADLVLISGLGKLVTLYAAHTRASIRYLPHYFDLERAGSPWTPSTVRKFKVSMIGTRGRRRRLPFLYMPGGRKRAALATQVSERYGSEFALYGRGWKGLASNRGAMPWEEQERAIRDSWVSINHDHFDDIPYYYSDRLPISLAAGVPHVTSWHAGYEDIFRGCRGLYWGKSVDEILDCLDWLLGRSPDELIEEGLAAHDWVKANLEASIVFTRAFDMCAEQTDPATASQA